MEKFSDLLQEKHFKFGAEWRGVGKICVFQQKTGHISKTVKDTVEVTINH